MLRSPRLWVSLLLSFGLLTYITIYSYDILEEDAGCTLADKAQSDPFEKMFYDSLMRLRFTEAHAHQVSLVTITEGSEPLSVITNTCESRRFLTDLVHELDLLKARVIAVDQSFSDGACPEGSQANDQTNNRFREAFEHASPPIVVGWATHKRPDATDDDDTCLTLNVPFSFNRAMSGAIVAAKDNVFFGLIRLNENTLKIPLQWAVFPDKQASLAGETKIKLVDSFSLRAATLAKPSLLSESTLAEDIAKEEHPYSSFVRKLPSWSAMDVLCYGPGKVAKKRPDWGSCDDVDHHSLDGLAGQVVVIGSEIASEAKPFLGGRRYGAELHANYIEALLDGRYVKTINPRLDKGAVYFFAAILSLLQVLAALKLPAPWTIGEGFALWLPSAIFAVFAVVAWVLLDGFGWFFPVFFLSVLPIFIGLLLIALPQLAAKLHKKNPEEKEGSAT